MLALCDIGVVLVAEVMPAANDLTAEVDLSELDVLSLETREALAVAKARGV